MITWHVTVAAMASGAAGEGSGLDQRVVIGDVVIGWSEVARPLDADPFDVLLTADVDPPRPWVRGSIEEVERAVEASPAAATALVQLLRATERTSVADGLAMESMAYSMLQHGEMFQRWHRSQAVRESPRDPTADPVQLERVGNQLDIVLQRPHVHNALNAAMRDALCDALELVDLDPTIAEVHLRGDGPSFCSGGDLDEFGTATDAGAAHLLRLQRSVGRRIHDHADRTTAHLHGACIGAGIELAAFAGRVVATADTAIALPEVAMGLIPGAGGTISLPRRIGRHRTAHLALTGTRIGADLAHAWGLVDAIVPTEH